MSESSFIGATAELQLWEPEHGPCNVYVSEPSMQTLRVEVCFRNLDGSLGCRIFERDFSQPGPAFPWEKIRSIAALQSCGFHEVEA